MSSDENLQYMLLALVNGLEAYTKRTQHIQDVEHRDQKEYPKRQLDMEYERARLDSTRALTRKRERGATEDDDPLGQIIFHGVAKPHQMAVRTSVDKYLGDAGNDREKAITAAEESLANVDKDMPMPEGDPADSSYDVNHARAVEKNRREERARRASALGVLHTYKAQPSKAVGTTGRGYTVNGQYPQAQAQGPAPVGPASADPMVGGLIRPGQPFAGTPAGGAPPGASAGRLTGQVGPQTGGAKITPPRMPTPQVAEQNFQAFANAPQGPLANMGDQRRAGEVAQLWTVVMDQNMPFEQHASAWFKLHDILGVPVPDVFQQYATGMGIPRSAIDAAAGQQSVGSGGQPPGPQGSMSRPQSGRSKQASRGGRDY